MNKKSSVGFWLGVKDSVSIGLASGMLAIVFGALAHTKGLGVAMASLMSAGMYAGAGQMLAIKVWSLQSPDLLTLMLIVLVVCMRYFLMGVALRPRFAGLPRIKVYLSLFLLMDENWVLTLMKTKKKDAGRFFLLSYFVGAGMLSYLLWIIGTALGGLIANQVSGFSNLGIDFVFTALFLGLLVGLWRDRRDVLPWLVAFGVAIAAKLLLAGDWYVIMGAIAGSLVGAYRECA